MSKVIVIQKRSAIGSSETQRKVLKALGLRKINGFVKHNATPQILGMIGKVGHLVEIRKEDKVAKVER